MRTLLVYVVALILVGGLLFLAASFAFGRDEEMAPALPDGTPVELPDDRPATGADLRALRLAVVLRGYRMEEVDWVLDRLAEQIDSRDREIARLRSVLHVEPVSTQAPGLAAEDERLRAPEGPARPRARVPGDGPPPAPGEAPVRAPGGAPGEAPVRMPGETPVRMRPDGSGGVPVRDRRTGPGTDPVRGLRPDPPDRDSR